MRETVIISLLHSCKTIIMSQGISLHYNPQNKASIWLTVEIVSFTTLFFICSIMEKNSHIILIFLYPQCAVFLVNSCIILFLISLYWQTWRYFLPSSFRIINPFTFIFSTIHTCVGLNYGSYYYLFLVH